MNDISNNNILDNSGFSSIGFFDNESSLTQAVVLTCASTLATHSPTRIDGMQQGICILMSRSAQYITAIFAAWRSGFYVVPLNTAWPAQKNLDIINRIQPPAVMVDDGAEQAVLQVAA
jgi:acyl-CoA synthetase (AMP-forming)/AMP-acid ligase II